MGRVHKEKIELMLWFGKTAKASLCAREALGGKSAYSAEVYAPTDTNEKLVSVGAKYLFHFGAEAALGICNSAFYYVFLSGFSPVLVQLGKVSILVYRETHLYAA